MNFLDRFRYHYDNLKELDINNSSVNKSLNYSSPILKSLLSTSVKVTPEIFPKIDQSIKSVFEKLQLKNNFNFFVTANHNQTQAACAMMPESDSAEIIITSKISGSFWIELIGSLIPKLFKLYSVLLFIST